MTQDLNKLINALREELEQYGEMLARLDEQQEFAMRRAADDLLQSVGGVQEQGSRMRLARQQREAAMADLLRERALSQNTSFSQLLPHLPENYRPLVQALVRENNELLVRVQQRARQNHLLMLRSLELMQAFMSSLFPGGSTPVYNDAGGLLGQAVPKNVLYEAVG